MPSQITPIPHRETVAATPRRSLSRKAREAIYAREGGLCGLCGLPVALQEAEWDRRIERFLTQSDAPEQFWPAHKACHRQKTSARASVLAHVERLRKGPKKSARPIPQRVDPWPPKGSQKLQSRGFR